MKKYLMNKSTCSYLVDTNIKYEEERFSNLMTGINRFLTAMRMNGKRLTPKNYKLTKEVLEKISNGKIKITEITPIKKYEEEYTKGPLITKAKMTICFSEDILSLGSDEEIFRYVKKIIRKQFFIKYEPVETSICLMPANENAYLRNCLKENTSKKQEKKNEKV